MALDDLKETIETLRERIQAHRPIWKAMRRGRGRCLSIPCWTSWDGMLETPISSNSNTV